jgi:hypothetical protein
MCRPLHNVVPDREGSEGLKKTKQYKQPDWSFSVMQKQKSITQQEYVLHFPHSDDENRAADLNWLRWKRRGLVVYDRKGVGEWCLSKTP